MDSPLQDSPRYQVFKDRMCEAFGEDILPSVEVYLLFFRVARELFNAAQVHMGRYGLSDGRAGVLIQLQGEPEHRLTPSELAERMLVTRGTMTGLLDGLEHSGLVARKLHTEDRRMLTVQLTQKGIDLLEEILPEHVRRIKLMVERSGLSEEEQQQLVTLLIKVSKGISALTEP